jgi:hypothetical protein
MNPILVTQERIPMNTAKTNQSPIDGFLHGSLGFPSLKDLLSEEEVVVVLDGQKGNAALTNHHRTLLAFREESDARAYVRSLFSSGVRYRGVKFVKTLRCDAASLAFKMGKPLEVR